MVLPETINGNLDLSGLTSTEGLVLPETIEEGLVLPNDFKCNFIFTRFGVINPDDFYKYQKQVYDKEDNRKR